VLAYDFRGDEGSKIWFAFVVMSWFVHPRCGRAWPDRNRGWKDAIGAGIKSLKDDLRSRLLAAILDQPPDFFEPLVLQVLKAMGYGAEDEDALSCQHRSETRRKLPD